MRNIKEELKKWLDILQNEEYKFESPSEFFWTEVLGGCGCGTGDDIGEIAFKMFKYFSKEHLKRDKKFSNLLYTKTEHEVLAHWMDSKKIIEHGGSIYGSWLTEDGEKLLNAINKKFNNK